MITLQQALKTVGKGWHPLIEEFYKEFPEAIVVQVKEKYGTLRIYHDNCTEESLNKEIEIMDKSGTTCETCGKTGETRSIRNWIWTLCEEHYQDKLNS